MLIAAFWYVVSVPDPSLNYTNQLRRQHNEPILSSLCFAQTQPMCSSEARVVWVAA